MFFAASVIAALAARSACASSPAYGAEPWVSWWGSPAAAPSATVLSARGTARFTVLTPRLLRLEYSPDGAFEDARTLVILNRLLPVPPFAASTDGSTTTIDTGDFGVRLVYTDDGAPFSAASLSVERRTPAFWANASAVWTPADEGGRLLDVQVRCSTPTTTLEARPTFSRVTLAC